MIACLKELFQADVVLRRPIGLEIRITDVDVTVCVGLRQSGRYVEFGQLRRLKCFCGRRSQCGRGARRPDDSKTGIEALAE